jgi:16S rRNA (cytidine1402-2'-O)-methyltransferase
VHRRYWPRWRVPDCRRTHSVSGILPPKQQRRKALAAWGELEATLIFYEAPHRDLETLADVAAVLGERRIVLARELTKLHEEFLRGRVSEVVTALSQRATQKGEMTLLISREKAAAVVQAPAAEAVRELVAGRHGADGGDQEGRPGPGSRQA